MELDTARMMDLWTMGARVNLVMQRVAEVWQRRWCLYGRDALDDGEMSRIRPRVRPAEAARIRDRTGVCRERNVRHMWVPLGWNMHTAAAAAAVTAAAAVGPYEDDGEPTAHRTLLLVDTHRREAQFWDPSGGEVYYRERPGGPLLHAPIPQLLADAERRSMWDDMDLRFIPLPCGGRGVQDVIEGDETDGEPISGLCAAVSLLMYCVCLRANVTDLCTVNAALLRWAARFERQGNRRPLRRALALWFIQCNKASSPYRLASWIGLRTDAAYGTPHACDTCDRGPGTRQPPAVCGSPRARHRVALRPAPPAGVVDLPDAPRLGVPDRRDAEDVLRADTGRVRHRLRRGGRRGAAGRLDERPLPRGRDQSFY
jgi:hypothetical protein